MSSQNKYTEYFSLFDLIFTGIGIVNKDGHFVFVNTTLCETFGYTVNEFITKLSLTDLFKSGYRTELSHFSSTPFYNECELYSKFEEPHQYRIIAHSFSTKKLPNELSSYEFLNILFFHDIIKMTLSEVSWWKEWIEYASSKISIILFSHGKYGPEPLLKLNSEVIHNPEKTLIKFGVYLMAAIGQGAEHKTGLFGPLPVPDQDYLSIAYAFELRDTEQADPRFKGKRYVVLAILYPRSLDLFFQDRRQLRTVLKEQFSTVINMNDISITTLQNIHKAILQTNRLEELNTFTKKERSLELKLNSIYNLGKDLLHTTNLKASFEVIASLCEKSLDFKLFTGFYLDPSDGNLKILSHRGYPPELNLDKISLPLTTVRSVVATVARKGKILNIPDVNTIDFYMNIDYSVASELAVPIKVGNEILGVLNVESELKSAFTEDDESLLTIVAERAGMVLKQYQLQLRMQAVYSLAEEVSHAASLKEAFDKIALFAEQNLNFEIFSALVPDKNSKTLRFLCHRGYDWKSESDIPIIPIDSNEYFVSYIFRTGKPLYAENLNNNHEFPYYPVRKDICTEYAITIIIYNNARENEVIGILNMEGTKPFSSSDKYIFEILAFEATMVLRLFRYHDQVSTLLSNNA